MDMDRIHHSGTRLSDPPTGGSEGIAAALRSAGLPVTSAEPAGVQAKGSRPFAAVTDNGRRLFIKALGSDQRDADLLYRPTGSPGSATSATPGPPPRSPEPSSTRPSSR